MVYSTPVIDASRLFPKSERRECAASLVCIKGRSGEDLHYHTSHIVGFITRGEGSLRLPAKSGNGETELPVRAGDVVIIPRGALHMFECAVAQEMDYLALEVSEVAIDYQKHWQAKG